MYVCMEMQMLDDVGIELNWMFCICVHVFLFSSMSPASSVFRKFQINIISKDLLVQVFSSKW